MAKMVIGSGLDSYIKTLEELDIKTDALLGKAVYDGAKIVADQVRSNIKALPVSNSKKRGSVANQIDSITTAQKDGLLQGFGISKLKTQDGLVNVKLGFDGYNSQVSSTAKKSGAKNSHQPNIVIARSVETGTYFRKKHPFIAPAVRATKAAAEKAMADKLDQEIAKVMK